MNWREFIDAVRWAAGQDMPVTVGGPEYLVANVVAQPDKKRMVVHLVNYNARQAPLPEPVQVTCRVPAAAREIRLYSPDFEQPVALEAKSTDQSVTFTVPPVKVYSIAVASW